MSGPPDRRTALALAAAMAGIPAGDVPGIKEAINRAAGWAVSVAKSGVLEFLQEQAKVFQEIAAVAQRRDLWEREERELYAILVPRGWLLSPEVPASLLSRLLQIRKDHGLPAVDRELIRVYDPDFCFGLLEATYNRAAFKAWRPTFKLALSAHRRREFALSTPIWLAALEGLVAAELSTEKVYTNVTRRSVRSKLRAEIGAPDDFFDLIPEGWLGVLEIVGKSTDRRNPRGPSVLNRHAVLHGGKPRMGNERDSIQGILLLHLLHYFAEVRDQEVATGS